VGNVFLFPLTWLAFAVNFSGVFGCVEGAVASVNRWLHNLISGRNYVTQRRNDILKADGYLLTNEQICYLSPSTGRKPVRYSLCFPAAAARAERKIFPGNSQLQGALYEAT
jgi:hypothetical protein